MNTRLYQALWLCAVLAASAGCATTAARPNDAEEGQGATWFDGQSGEPLGASEVAIRLERANVILVGEKHADPASMAAHIAVLSMRKGHAVTVAVEWLPFSARLAVNGWLSSQEPAESLGEAVGWGRVWGHDLAAYRPVLDAVRRFGFALVPVNAEPGLARLVARHGVDGVPQERRSELPPLDSGNAAHRAWFEDIMNRMAAHGHGHGQPHAGADDPMTRLYLAQLVWDETMATRIAALAADKRQVIVFAGTGHVGFGFGIPERLPPTLEKIVVLPATSAAEARSRALAKPLSDGRGDETTRFREADLFVVIGEARLVLRHSESDRLGASAAAASAEARF